MILIKKIKSFSSEFWLINFLQFLEKLAYTSMLWQMPVYIAQKDVEGGLHWGQEVKGTIFLVWALVQNIIPILAGGMPIKFGYKKVFVISFLLILIGYIGLATQKDIICFNFSVMILGCGSGLLVPAIQGSLAGIMKEESQSFGWGIYFMMINISVLIGGMLSKYLKSFGWELLFIFSAIITLLNLIFTIFLFQNINYKIEYKFKKVITQGLKILKEKKYLAKFLLIMSGFTIVYMQFYETLPNFIYDWIDSSEVVALFNLPKFMLMETSTGTMLSYEWLLNLNSILIIIFVIFITSYVFKKNIINGIIFGIIIASLGLIFCSSTMSGSILIIGITVYTFGEMLVNPKFHQYFAITSPSREKSIYMSFIKISFAIGLGLGGILGGFIYKHLGEKASLAQRFLSDRFNIYAPLSNSFTNLQEQINMNAQELTILLWNTYSPYLVFIPFAIIGILSAIGLLLIKNKLKELLYYEQPLE